MRHYWSLLIPLLAVGFLTHAILPLARLGLVYLAIDRGFDATTIAIVSAFYALVPVFLTVSIGRHNDRGGYRTSVVAGAVLMGVSAAILLLLPVSVATLLASNAVMGVGQALLINSVQTMLKQAGPSDDPDSAVGYYMVVVSIAQVGGPLLIALLAASPGYSPMQLIQVCLEISVALVAASVIVGMTARHSETAGSAAPTAALDLLRSAPLRWTIISSAIAMAAGDLILIFLPLLGTERGIDTATIGLLLAFRSAAALPTRTFYRMLARRLGHRGLIVLGMLAGAAGFVLAGMPLPLWLLGVCVALTGVGQGIVMPVTLSLTFSLAPATAVGMATSLRTTLSRITQFGGPFAAGMLASASGSGSVFVVTGGLMAVSAIGTLRALRHPRNATAEPLP